MPTSSIIFLWAHPRSISTAFERAFIQRDDFVSIHEPYSEPFYVGPARLSTRYSEEYCANQKHIRNTYTEATEEIITTAEQNIEKKVFCKDMALYVIHPDWQQHPENPTVLDLEFLKSCTHTFLIRNPKKSIPSLYLCCKEVENDATFNTQEAGFSELRNLYNFLTKLQTESSPLLIDADDLLKNPLETMKIYCSRIGIEFKPEMMEWKAEKVESFNKWEGYHTNAEQSTGLKEIVKDRSISFPISVYETIQENMPIYEELWQHRFRL